MSKRANTTAIGAFVIGAIALTLTAVVLLGTGQFFNERVVVVTVFEGSVTGLEVGSPVEFRGVPVGTVKSIKALYDPDRTSFVIPVFMSIDSNSVTNIGEDEGIKMAANDLIRELAGEMVARERIVCVVTGDSGLAAAVGGQGVHIIPLREFFNS